MAPQGLYSLEDRHHHVCTSCLGSVKMTLHVRGPDSESRCRASYEVGAGLQSLRITRRWRARRLMGRQGNPGDDFGRSIWDQGGVRPRRAQVAPQQSPEVSMLAVRCVVECASASVPTIGSADLVVDVLLQARDHHPVKHARQS
eukprot:751991-Hanusia_phi.AAC.6